jgi:hypothetical protein
VLSREFVDVIEESGEGRVVGQYELAPHGAYARFITSDLEGGSDHLPLLVRLAKPSPTLLQNRFRCSPHENNHCSRVKSRLSNSSG